MSRRPPRPLGRVSGSAPRQIAVFTEGKKTEPDYLAYWHRAHRDRVQVVIFGDGRPARSNPSSGVWKLVDRITGQAPGDMLPRRLKKVWFPRRRSEYTVEVL